jgi:nitrilase
MRSGKDERVVTEKSVRVAVVQAASVHFDREASVDKACRLIGEAATEGARVILLPEAFIPAYPRGLSFGIVVGSRSDAGRMLWQRYWENAVVVPGPETVALGAAARNAGSYVAIGVIEREGGTLYCTLLIFGPNGQLLAKHRKLKPTGAERLIWGEGDGTSLRTIATPFGPLGGLICWENYMPLARMTLYQQGVAIYLAPTADARETWQATLRHIACEGRCFVLGANQFVTRVDLQAAVPEVEDLHSQPEIMSRGGSVIVSPLGHVLAGPLIDEEGILFADLDLGEIIRGKLDFDVAGHYARPDVFQFGVRASEDSAP